MASPWRKAALPLLLSLELAACAAPTAAPEECTGMFIPPKGYIGINLDVADRLDGSPRAVLQTDYLPKNPGSESTLTHYAVLWIPDGNGGWVVGWEGWLDSDQTIRGPGFDLFICIDKESCGLPRMHVEESEIALLDIK